MSRLLGKRTSTSTDPRSFTRNGRSDFLFARCVVAGTASLDATSVGTTSACVTSSCSSLSCSSLETVRTSISAVSSSVVESWGIELGCSSICTQVCQQRFDLASYQSTSTTTLRIRNFVVEMPLKGQAGFFTIIFGAFAASLSPAGPGTFCASAVFQSAGGSAMPHTFPCVYSAAPIRNHLPSLPSGRQFATRAVTLPPPGSPLSMIGVSGCSASELRKPHPVPLTITTEHFSPNGRLRSRLMTLTGISTRIRVLRRIALAVCTSMRSMRTFYFVRFSSRWLVTKVTVTRTMWGRALSPVPAERSSALNAEHSSVPASRQLECLSQQLADIPLDPSPPWSQPRCRPASPLLPAIHRDSARWHANKKCHRPTHVPPQSAPSFDRGLHPARLWPALPARDSHAWTNVPP